MVRRPNDDDEATGNFAQDDIDPPRHVPRPLAAPDEDDGDFEGDDPPTTAEPVRDDHHPQIAPRSPSIATRPIPKFRSDDAFDDDANPTMFDPHVPTGGAPRAASDPYAPPSTNRVDDRQTKDLSAAARRAMEPTADLGPTARRAFADGNPRPATLPPPLPPMVASGSSGPRRAPEGPRNPPGPTGPMLRPPPTAPPALASNASGSQRVISATGSQRAIAPIAPAAPPSFITDRKAALSGPNQPPSQAAPTMYERPNAPGRVDDSSRTHRWDGRPQAEQLPPPPVYPQAYPPAYPPAAQMHAPAPMPMQAISHKTPGGVEAPRMAPRQMPQVQIRSMSDLNKTPIGGMGRLAPPRDPNRARARNMQDVMIWGSVVVITASIVTLVIWLIAR